MATIFRPKQCLRLFLLEGTPSHQPVQLGADQKLEQGAPKLQHVFGKNKHGDLKSTVASPTHENRIVEEPNVIPRTISPYENEWQKVAFLLHLQQAYCFFLGKI